MKRIDFDSADFRLITMSIDTRYNQLIKELCAAEDVEDAAGHVFDETETDEAWNALNAATAERKRIEHAMDDLRKLAEAMYSAAIAFDNLRNENEWELKNLGLI